MTELRCQVKVADISVDFFVWEPYVDGILPNGPYPPCLRMADRALLAGYPRCVRKIVPDFMFHNLFYVP